MIDRRSAVSDQRLALQPSTRRLGGISANPIEQFGRAHQTAEPLQWQTINTKRVRLRSNVI